LFLIRIFNRGGYERAGTVSDREATEMLLPAKNLLSMVQKWLSEKHPELLTEKTNK